MALKFWLTGAGELVLLVGLLRCWRAYWYRISTIWATVGAFALPGALFVPLPSKVSWALLGVFALSAVGLWAMASGKASIGGGEDM